MGGWFKKEINTIEDLKGLKMRIPGFAGEIMAAVGAKPTNIPAGELYTALDRGTIDAPSVATDDGLDAVFGVNLIHQFLSATVFKPSVLLSCRHTKGH
jgi:TRAP-type mannitol/chloroaromatic compound transport system substrate-binding protein